jgi:undecaprenyl pyrophosphate phosphatase UppP
MLDVLLITAIQIIVEALPVSSSGHAVLAQLLWEKYAMRPLTPLPDFFDHFLHGPTVVVLLVVFFKDWFSSAQRLLCAWWALVCGHRAMTWSERRLSQLFFKVFGFICAADAVTAIAYFSKIALGRYAAIFIDPRVLLGCFVVTLLLLLSLLFVGRWAGTGCTLTLGRALAFGAAQGIAYLLTGISRLGITYVVGRWTGLSPRRSFQFSFLIQFPLIAAAFAINGIRGMCSAPEVGAFVNVPMLATMLGATIVAGFLFAGVYRLALQRRLWWFGVYLVVPIGILVMLMLGR